MTSVQTVPKVLGATGAYSATVDEFREIPLSRGYVAKVSPEDYDRVVRFPWFALVTKGGVYAAYKPSYSKKTILLHRVILDAPDGSQVDHRRRQEKLNCTRGNLRVCTPAQNAWNTVRGTGRSGFIGVIQRHISQRFGPRFVGLLRANGKVHRTKTFPSAVLAAAARDVLAREFHGEFCVLNFKTPPPEVCA